jgi:AcrR family transcriptional regulator
MTDTASSPRERILETAAELFYSEGIRAVGVDTIIAKAKVAKASFYKHFPSKDDLVVAFLQRRDTQWREMTRSAIDSLNTSTTSRPLAIFDVLAQRFAKPQFRGCAFINSIVELANREHAAHQAADVHKKAVTAYLAELLSAAGASNVETLAHEFMVLVDGAIVTALREGSPRAARDAKRIAGVLLQQAGVKI